MYALHCQYLGQLTLCMLGNLLTFFSELDSSLNSSRNTIRVSNCLEQDQDGHSVNPDQGQTVCKDYLQTTAPV